MLLKLQFGKVIKFYVWYSYIPSTYLLIFFRGRQNLGGEYVIKYPNRTRKPCVGKIVPSSFQNIEQSQVRATNSF